MVTKEKDQDMDHKQQTPEKKLDSFQGASRDFASFEKINQPRLFVTSDVSCHRLMSDGGLCLGSEL